MNTGQFMWLIANNYDGEFIGQIRNVKTIKCSDPTIDAPTELPSVQQWNGFSWVSVDTVYAELYENITPEGA